MFCKRGNGQIYDLLVLYYIRLSSLQGALAQAFANSENPGQDSDPRKGEANDDADDADEPILCDREVQTEFADASQVHQDAATSKTLLLSVTILFL